MANGELSQRENDVLQLVVRGLSNDEIASQLAISRRTVETHLRMIFRKTGVARRGQLAAVARGAEPPAVATGREPGPPPEPGRPSGRGGSAELDRRRLELFDKAVRHLTDRQFPLFDERVELTVTVGEHDGQDGIVERRWTTPKPYLIHRVLRPIVTRTGGAPVDPDQLALACDVEGQDIQAELSPMHAEDGQPMVMVLFQPGLQARTEWTLRYRSPGLWDPLRSSGEDALTWWTATVDQRHRPTVDRLTLRVVFPRGWMGAAVIEQGDLGESVTGRLPTGQTEVTWQDSTPMASGYRWLLRGGPGRT